MKIGIIGLGFVGLSLATFLGSKGYKVIGIDSDIEKISKIFFWSNSIKTPNIIHKKFGYKFVNIMKI